MVEQEGGKQGDKFDFNSAGEALGYISLDQARILALQHARDNREFYGRYAQRDLAWDILSSNQTEDYYEVRLAYRPAGNFRTSGVEQFTIGKTGPIEFRQIVQQPRLARGFVAIAIAIVLGIAGATIGGLFVTGALGGSTTTDTPAPLITSVSITPNALARLVSPDGKVAINLEAQTVNSRSQQTIGAGYPANRHEGASHRLYRFVLFGGGCAISTKDG